MLAHMARFVAVKAMHQTGNKQGHLHLLIANCDLFREFWSVEGQKQGVGGDLFSIPLHHHPVDLNYTLFLQFHLDFHLCHAGQLTAADDATWWVQHFVDGNTYWSINELGGLQKTHRLRFPSALHQERSIPQPFNAFEGSGHWLEPLLDSKGRQFTPWEVITPWLHDQKPWPVVTWVVGAFVIQVHVRILVVVP